MNTKEFAAFSLKEQGKNLIVFIRRTQRDTLGSSSRKERSLPLLLTRLQQGLYSWELFCKKKNETSCIQVFPLCSCSCNVLILKEWAAYRAPAAGGEWPKCGRGEGQRGKFQFAF